LERFSRVDVGCNATYTTNITFIYSSNIKTEQNRLSEYSSIAFVFLSLHFSKRQKEKIEVFGAKFEQRGWRAVAVAVSPQQQRACRSLTACMNCSMQKPHARDIFSLQSRVD
jgi:hypothetical protein